VAFALIPQQRGIGIHLPPAAPVERSIRAQAVFQQAVKAGKAPLQRAGEAISNLVSGVSAVKYSVVTATYNSKAICFLRIGLQLCGATF
jgi:hypothetical protein